MQRSTDVQHSADVNACAQDLGEIRRPLPPQPDASTPNSMGSCGSHTFTQAAATPAAASSADGGAMVSAATGRGLPVPEAAGGGPSDGQMALDSPGAVGLAATALGLAAAALIVVVLYAVRLRQRRRRFIASRAAHAMAKADTHEEVERGGPEAPVLSGDEGLSNGLVRAGAVN